MIYVLIFVLEFVFLFILSKLLIRSISIFFLKVARKENLAIRLFHLFLLPGVIVHELAHLLVAEAILVRTSGLNFTPELDGDRVVMGSVAIQETDPIRRAIIGFAPVFVGIILIYFFIFFFLSDGSPIPAPWNYLLVLFMVFQIGNTMFSSSKDLEGSLFLIIVISISASVCYFFGVRFPDWFTSYFNSQAFTEIVKKGIWILSIPIIIDFVIILLSKLKFKS